MYQPTTNAVRKEPWNKGKLVGQKPPLKLKEIWAIRIRLQLANRRRDLALFNLAIDSKLRACDLVALRVRDVSHGDVISSRAIVMQRKTQRTVQFEITKDGTTKNIIVIESSPEGVFDQAAMDAAEIFRYQPRIVDGESIDVPGVQNKITFEIEP